MSSFRLRTAQGKLKIEHSILDDLRPVLLRLVAREDVRPPAIVVVGDVVRHRWAT